MDKLEQRLKRDAANIRADVPPELRERIDASLHDAARQRPAAARKALTFPMWLAASLSGAAAAVLVFVVIGRDAAPPEPANDQVARSVPDYVQQVERGFPLEVETAELTAPLEEELRNLRADLEKARENVEEDLDFSF